ncbi:hypothetical protein EV177_003488 [Coemansia sp. RSA 1804]|nr:hypothetical protein EV177_003488 [Coemansia sp. RSA 1804]
MSQSDWETDSDYRHFNPGMYAMRQLGRSVSRSTKRLLKPSRTKRNAEAEAPDGQEAQEALDGETSAGRGTSSAAGNGYVAFDFDNDNSRRATAATTDSAEAPPFRRGPPQPSGIHRRSVSFDNLVALPDSIPRRSTEPAHSTEKSPSTEIAPHTVGLPESSTWNSGHTVTKAAAMTALGQRASSQRPDYVYDATRRKWVPEFAYSPHRPQRVSTSGDGTRISLSARPPSAYWPTDGVVQQAAPHAGGSRHRKGSAAKRTRHNRESFSAPSHLDASTHFSESQTSAVNASDQFHDHPRMWRNEETPGANINGSDPKEPELLVAAAEISAAAAKADIAFAKQNRQSSNGQARNADPQVLPSMPVSSGLFRKRSAHNQTPASRESSQRKLGNFARVIGNISRRLNRIRSNRSASQPATPAEVRRSILESARQNMLDTPEESGHGFYRFVVNPADPVSDADSVEPDSPTISHHPSSARPSRHQRSTSFPSNGVGSARLPFEAGGTREADRASYAGASNSAANAAPANAISYMHNTTAVNINEINSHSSHAEFVQLESIAVSQDATFSTVHMESLRPEAIFQSKLTPRRVSSDSAWLRQAQSRAGPPMNNQGHDGSLSAVVQAKLDSKFIDSVHVSTRLNSNSNTNSSYGTFVRFHNSGELNGIFSTDQEAHPMARDNESIHQAQASDASLPEHPSAENISIQQIRQQNAADNINSNDSDDAAYAVGNNNANARVEVEHEFSRAPSQAGAAFVSDRRARKQENIRQFVEEMRAAREDSVKRKRDAEMRRQIFNNDQAMLDASVYVYERQQKKVAQDRQRIEQMQQLLEESQLEYLKVKLSERIRQQQLQSQQQRQQLEAPHESDTGVAGSSSNTVESESGGGKCMPPVVFHRGQGGRLRHRRKSEGSGQRNAVVKESGRRRTTMLGLFCAPNDDDAASADTFADPLPTRLPRKGTAGTLPNSGPFANMAQLHKDLPPLPIARRHNGVFQANGPESENDHPTELAVSDEQRISPLRKSRSFSHFGSREEVVVPTEDPWTRHSNNNPEAGLRPSSDQIAGSMVPDAKDGAKERRASRAGVLLGVLGLFSSNYARRRSNAQHSAVSQDDQQQQQQQQQQQHNNAKGGNRRKIALHRGQQQQQQRRRRHTLGGAEADSNGNEARLPVLLPGESDTHAPNVHVRMPKESLSNEIYAGFVQSATDDAQSSSRRRMYSHILNTLQGTDAQPVVLGPVPRNNRNSQSKADVIQKMGARAEDVDASIKDGADAQLPTSANNGESDADRWRDSAITGILTQVSAGTSQIRKSMGAEAAYAPEEQNPANNSAQEEAKISESETSSGDDDPLAKQRQYKHVVRFEETAGLKKRTSSLALDTITARTESGELYKQKAKHKKKPMARTTPHSYNASQAVSLDGSIADIASGNTEAYRYNLVDLPGLEGVDTPSTNDAMMSPGPSTPRHLPANERLRRLEYEVFGSGKSARSAGSSHDYAHVGRSTSTAVPFDSPVSDSGTGKTQILGFAKANIRANTDADFTTRYRRPSARPEIRDVRGIAWDDSNPTTTAAESTELFAAGVGLFGGIVSPAVPLVGKNRSALGNRTADTLNTLSGSANQKPAGGTLDGGDSDDDAPLAVGTFPPRFATVATADGLHKSLAKANDMVAAGDSSQQPVDPALLARLVQTSPDPRNLIYDASSQFGTMRSPKSVGFAVSDSSSVGESNEGRRELLVDIVARIAKHNGGIATQKLQSSEDMANSIEIPVVSKSQSAPSATPSPRNMSAGSHNSKHIRVGDELMVTANSRGSLGLYAAYGDGRSLQRDSDHLETTIDSEAVARESTQAIELFAPTDAATVAATTAATAAAAAVSGASGNDMGIVPSMKQAAEGATDKGVAQHEDSSLAFQEYVEQQRKLPRDRTSHAGMEQLNFRVSLLDRPMPEHNRRSRSVSLPAPQRTASVLENKAWQQRRPSTHQQMGTAEQSFDHYAHQRTKSFYESSPLVQTLLKPELPPLTATTHSKSQGADEEMADRALFSHLLGDGAALTPSDAQVARRQSTTSSLAPTAPQLFDPIRDTGENGVPDSVLRAYLAGDITAIERFFEHIMRITAPSSVYDGEASEDGDWTYGLEGPPSKAAAKEDADTATKDVFSVSREVPGMIDTSATASNALTSSHNLQQQATAQNSASQTPTETNQGPITATSDRSLAATNAISVSREHVGPDTSHSANVSPDMRVDSNLPLPDSNLSSPGAVVLQEPVSQQEVLSVQQSEHPSLSKVERIAMTAAAATATDKPQRKIAIPRPKLSRALNSSESVSESTHAKDASTSIVAQSVLNDVAGTPEAHPLQSWDDSEKFVSSEFSDKRAGRAIDPVVEVSIPDDILVSYADNAKCLSPARLPLHSRDHHERDQVGLSQRKPIPVDGTRSKKQEKQHLLTRLRVLEGMIQKSAIEESRLQPPPALREAQIVKDMESLASIYSSSMELDYDRINMELSRSVRNSANKKQGAAANTNGVTRPLPLPNMYAGSPKAGSEAEQLPAPQPRYINEKGQRAEVLKRLRRNSHARAKSHYRASVLNRQAFVSPGQSAEDVPNKALYTKKWHGKPMPIGSTSRTVQSGRAKDAVAIPNISTVTEGSDATYSARSSGSIRIEIVEEGSFAGAHGSRSAGVRYRQHALPLPSTDRFRRTAKLLT